MSDLYSPALDPPPGGEPCASSLADAESVIRNWPADEPFHAEQILSAHPEWRDRCSIVVDLAYEEFRRFEEAGCAVSAVEFAGRFGEFASEVFRMLDFEGAMQDDLDSVGNVPGALWPEVGDEFAGYELQRLIGSGAASRVYLASDPRVGRRQVVVKAGFRGVLEAQKMGRLDHENIVDIYHAQIDADSELHAICMPFVGLTTLADVIACAKRRVAVPLDAGVIDEALAARPSTIGPPKPQFCDRSYMQVALEFGRQLAQALASAHDKGLCHGDIKPQNVLLASDGRPRILDFNLAFQPALGEAHLGGTIPYASPEQLRGLTGARPTTDERSDIFSLGATLYEFLTATLPFGLPNRRQSTSGQAAQILQRQSAGVLIPPRELNAHIDERTAKVILRCLSLDPTRRPQTATQLASELHDILAERFAGKATTAAAPATGKPRGRWRIVAIACGLAIAVLAAVVLSRSNGTSGTPTPRPAPEKILLADAWDELIAGRASESARQFTALLKDSPGLMSARLGRGLALMRLGNPAAALPDLQEVAGSHRDYRARAALACCRAMLGESAVGTNGPNALKEIRDNLQSILADVPGDASTIYFEAALLNDIAWCEARLQRARGAADAVAIRDRLSRNLRNVVASRSLAASRVDRSGRLSFVDQLLHVQRILPEMPEWQAEIATTAIMTAPFARKDPRTIALLTRVCRSAIEAGVAFKRLQVGETRIPGLRESAEFRALEHTRTGELKPQPLQLLDPFEYLAAPILLNAAQGDG